MPDVAKEIMEIIGANASADYGPLNLSDPLDDIGLNSMDVVNVIFAIEEKFDVQIPFNANSDIEAKTVADLIKTVEELVSAKSRAV